jgi:hypothetical protein
MEKKASIKQIKYLTYLLESDNKTLDMFTDKTIDQLTHLDIRILFSKLHVPITVDLRNFNYIINKDTDDYTIGTQYNKSTNQRIMDIISFKNLMVLDYDVDKKVESKDLKQKKLELLETIENRLSETEYQFLVYETYSGYHLYCISHIFRYNEHSVHKLMEMLGCDKFYIGFTRYVGFAVRINKKPNRDEVYIERFVKKINENIPCIDKLVNLIKLKDNIINIINN